MAIVLHIIGVVFALGSILLVVLGIWHVVKSGGTRANIQDAAILTGIGAFLFALSSFFLNLGRHA